MKRRLFSFILTAVMVLSCGITSFASTNSTDIRTSEGSGTLISEYDIFMDIRKTPNDKLLQDNYTQEEIDFIKSDNLENLILERAMLPEKELQNMGYTKEQIDILKNYDGSPIEDNPQLMRALGDCIGTVTPLYTSSNYFRIRLDWEWVSPPLLNGYAIQDAIGVRWQGTDSAGSPLNVSLRQGSSNSYNKIWYMSGGSLSEVQTKALEVVDAYGSAKSIFRLGTYSGSGDFAKYGHVQIIVDKTGTKGIHEIALNFSYGHSTLTTTPSVSFPLGFSISFGTGVSKQFEIVKRVKVDGTVVNY